MKTLFNILPFILAISLIIASCDTTEPPIIPPPPVVKDTITVEVESFTHRSVTLKVQSTTNSPQSTIKVFRIFNNILTVIAEYPILVKDTTIIDDNNGTGLLLDTTYTYFAVRVDSLGKLKDTSNIVTQRTLAPTSHNYTWQEFTIGDWQSALYDVWGTDENNVWAVGSLSIGGKFYGALHWNGIEWIPDSTVGGSAIYGFTSNDIWVVGGGIFHYDGNRWIDYSDMIRNPGFYDNGPYTSIWGTSSSNLYLGNHWGKIIHWDGSKASVVYENPNNIRIWDIFGLSNNFILSTGNSGVSPSFAIRFNGTNWENLEGIDYSTHLFATVYVINPKEYYVGGAAAYGYLGNQWEPIPGNLYRLRGNKTTGELVGVGPGNVMNYYNGKQWYSFRDQINNEFAALYGVFVTEHKIFSVGITTTRAKIYIGSK